MGPAKKSLKNSRSPVDQGISCSAWIQARIQADPRICGIDQDLKKIAPQAGRLISPLVGIEGPGNWRPQAGAD